MDFYQIVTYLEKEVLIPVPTLEERFEIIKEHLALQVAYAGEDRGIKEMRNTLLGIFRVIWRPESGIR